MRFYVNPDYIILEKDIIEVRDRDEVHHIRDVMRLKEGAIVTVFDGKGIEYAGNIKEIHKDLILITIKTSKSLQEDRQYKITLFQAIPKKAKMDFIVEKAVELGVDTIVPIITERTVQGIKSNADKKKGRWIKISRSASKQCGRASLALVSDIIDFSNALEKARDMDMVVFAALDEGAVPLRNILTNKNPKSIAVFVGPEGDFSPDEINKAKEQGYSIASLGHLVLRVDTAAIYILSCINFSL